MNKCTKGIGVKLFVTEINITVLRLHPTPVVGSLAASRFKLISYTQFKVTASLRKVQ